jgi:glyceraldehyde 3-phosphate dehydrogenase
MKRLKIGLNGFGRIGRAFTRIGLSRDRFDVAVINTRKTDNKMLSYLLKHDSVYRTFGKNVKEEKDGIIVDGKKITTTLADKPENIPWENYGVNLVIDATGAFKTKEELIKHLKGTVKKVIATAPLKDETPHVVLGVNDDKIDWQKENVISMASCTTNCAAPMFKVIDDNFKIISGFLTTAHAYTLTQSLLDDAGKDTERSRAAALNIIPSTTGAASAVVKTLPQLLGKIDGMAIRVPVPIVSFTDISCVVEKPTTIEEINLKFQMAAQSTMKNILCVEKETLVSSDFIGSPYSCIFDANYTKVINGNFIKIFGWYDNEWGYSTRLVDLVEKVGDFINQ